MQYKCVETPACLNTLDFALTSCRTVGGCKFQTQAHAHKKLTL